MWRRCAAAFLLLVFVAGIAVGAEQPPAGSAPAPAEANWPAPDPKMAQELEAATGLLDVRFAFCQTMPLDKFQTIVETLRAAQYRPVRVRPFLDGTEIRVAAVWTRDDRPWRLRLDAVPAEILAQHADLRAQGFAAADVAGYARSLAEDGQDRYAALWSEQKPAAQFTDMYVGVAGDDKHALAYESLLKQGLLPATCHGFRNANGQVLWSGVWVKNAADAGRWQLWWGQDSFYERKRYEHLSNHAQVDVAVFAGDDVSDVRQVGVWRERNARLCQEFHGITPEEHVTRCRALIASGYRPVAISVVAPGASAPLRAAAVWQREYPAELAHTKVLLEQSWDAVTKSDFVAAERLVREAAEVRKRWWGETHPDYLLALRNLAVVLLRAGRPEDGLAPMRQVLQTRVEHLGDQHADCLEDRDKLATLLEHVANHRQRGDDLLGAVLAWREVLQLRAGRYDAEDWRIKDPQGIIRELERILALTRDRRAQLTQADRLLAEAQTLRDAGKFAEALQAVSQALQIRRELLGTDSRAYIECAYRMAELYLGKGEPARAEQLLREITPVFARLFGEKHRAFASLLDNRGQAHTLLGECDRAAPLLRRALEIQSQQLGKYHADYVATRWRLVEVLETLADQRAAAGDGAGGLATRRELLALRVEQYGPNDWRVIDERLRVADLEAQQAFTPAQQEQLRNAQQAYVEARRWLAASDAAKLLSPARAAAEAFAALYSPQHRLVGDCWYCLAWANQAQRQFQDAGSYYEQAERIYEQVLGPDHPEQANIYLHHSLLLQLTDDWEGAERLARQAIAIRDRVLGSQHERSMEARGSLAGILESRAAQDVQREDFASARRRQQEACVLTRTRYGPGHYRTLNLQLGLNQIDLLERASPEQRRQLAEADQADRQAEKATQQGDLPAAVEAYDQSLRLRKAVLGDKHPYVAATLHSMGVLAHRRGDYARAEQLLREALAIRKTALGPQHVDYAHSLNQLGWVLQTVGDNAGAASLHEQAGKVFEDAVGKNSWPYAETLNYRAMAARAQKEYDRAAALLQEAQAVYRQLSGEKTLAYAAARFNLGLVHQDRKEFQQAETLLQEAAEIEKPLLGENDPERALTLASLGWLYALQGDYRRAEPLLVQALRIQKDRLGERHPRTMESLQRLAQVYRSLGESPKDSGLAPPLTENPNAAAPPTAPDHGIGLHHLAVLSYETGDYDRAESLLREIIRQREETLSPEHALSRQAQQSLAAVLDRRAERRWENDDLAGALRDRRERVAIARRLYPDKEWWTTKLQTQAEELERATQLDAAARRSLRDVERRLQKVAVLDREGRAAEVTEALRTALDDRRRILGDRDWTDADLSNWLARQYVDQERFPEAEALLQHALETGQRLLGEDHPEFGRLLATRGYLCVRTRQYARAEPLLLQARGIYEKRACTEHEYYADALEYLGAVYWRLGDYRRAEALFRQQLDIRQRILGENHRSYATSLQNLANLYRDMKDLAKAEPLLRRAAELRKQTLGEDHPDYARSLRVLGSLCARRNDFAQAEVCLRKVLDIWRRYLGTEHPDFRAARSNLVELLEQVAAQHVAQERFDQARQAREEILAVLSEQGVEPWRVTDARLAVRHLERLAALDRGQLDQLPEAKRLIAEVRRLDKGGDYRAALPLSEQAVALLGPALGEDAPEYLQELEWLARLCRLDKQFARAEEPLRRVLDGRRRVQGDAHPMYLNSLVHLANLYSQSGDAARAESPLREALAGSEELYGRDAAQCETLREKLDTLLSDLAEQYAGKEDFPAAQRAAEQALELCVARHGADDWRSQDARLLVQYVARRAQLTPAARQQLAAAQRLFAQAESAREAGRGAEARAPAKQAAELFRAVLGADSPQYADSLVTRGLLADDAQALSDLQAAKEIRGRVLGTQHPRYAQVLHNEALTLAAGGRGEEAEPLLRQALEIYVPALGSKDPLCDRARDELIDLLSRRTAERWQQKDYDQVQRVLQQLVELSSARHGEDHWRTRDARISLEVLKRGAAMSEATRAQAEALGEELSGLDGLLEAGNGREALRVAERVRRDCKELLGEQAPEYFTALERLALVHDWLGNAVQAERTYRQLLDLQLKLLGPKHPSVGETFGVLTLLCVTVGDSSVAELYARQALAIEGEARGTEQYDYALRLNNLAFVLYNTGRCEEAEPLFAQATELVSRIKGEASREYALYLHNQASCARALGQYARARELSERALAIAEQALGKDHADYAEVLEGLGVLDEVEGHYEQAASTYRRTLDILGRRPGRPPDLNRLRQLAHVYLATEDAARAEPLLRQVLEAGIGNLRLAAGQSERRQLLSVAGLRAALDDYLALARRGLADASRAYGYLLGTKGAVLAQQRQLRRERFQLELLPLVDKLEDVNRQLAKLAFGESTADTASAKDTDPATALTEQKETIESELAARSTAFRRRRAEEDLTPQGLQALLPADVALIDYVVYDDFGPAGQDPAEITATARLAAYIVRSGRAIVPLDLGPAEEVERLVRLWRKTLGGSAEARQAARRLKAILWSEAALEALAGAQTVLIAPDGALTQFPFTALPGKEPGRFLIEELALAIIPTPRLLAEILGHDEAAGPDKVADKRTSPREAATPALLLVGNVDFGAAPGATPLTPNGPLPRHGVRDSDGRQYDELPGTKKEVETVRSLFGKYVVGATSAQLDRGAASEQAFRQAAPRYTFLHLATHGFFAHPDRARVAGSAAATAASKRHPDQLSHTADLHPGLLSGLVLAGANHVPDAQDADGQGRDDGLLTALEVAELDLVNTTLVVLSACQTGLGEVAAGEGTIGLQRAFQVAGAQACIASLWSVDDAATQLLMTEFYTNLWEKKLPKLEALRQAQLAMLHQYDPRHKRFVPRGERRVGQPAPDASPSYWAAFMLSGDWR